MIAARLDRLQVCLERRPRDLEAWLALADWSARAGRLPPFLSRDRHLPGLRGLWSEHPGERGLARLVLPLMGLVPVAEDLAPPPPIWGQAVARAPEGPYQRASGLPLRASLWMTGGRMLLVPGGEVLQPGGARHRVEDFYLGEFPVTVHEFGLFLARFQRPGGRPRPPADWEEQQRDGAAPVTGVDWFDASALCELAGGALPDDAAWLRAAQGGAGGERLPEESPAGVAELASGLQEWCADWHGSHVIPWKPNRFVGPPRGALRVVRGATPTPGGRRAHSPLRRYPYVGFRVAISAACPSQA